MRILSALGGLVGFTLILGAGGCQTRNPPPFNAPSSQAIALDLASYRQPILESLTVKIKNSPRLDIKVCSHNVCKLSVLKNSQQLIDIPLNSESISLRSCRSNEGKSCGKWQTFALFESPQYGTSMAIESDLDLGPGKLRPPLAKLFKSIQKLSKSPLDGDFAKPIAVKLKVDQARLEISAHIR